MGSKFYTADRETGTFIDEFDSLSLAEEAIAIYEAEDDCNNVYVPNFYDIVDEDHNSVMHHDGRRYYAIQVGDDDCDCGYGSYIYDTAWRLAEEQHRIYPNEEIRIVKCREYSDFADGVDIVFKKGEQSND